MKPQEDEFFAYTKYGTRVTGRYEGNGWFIVDPSDRSEEGCCDGEGYLLDLNGQRVYSDQMKQRLMKRRDERAKKGNKPQADEKYCYVDGIKIEGHYEKSGEFVVSEAKRG